MGDIFIITSQIDIDTEFTSMFTDDMISAVAYLIMSILALALIWVVHVMGIFKDGKENTLDKVILIVGNIVSILSIILSITNLMGLL